MIVLTVQYTVYSTVLRSPLSEMNSTFTLLVIMYHFPIFWSPDWDVVPPYIPSQQHKSVPVFLFDLLKSWFWVALKSVVYRTVLYLVCMCIFVCTRMYLLKCTGAPVVQLVTSKPSDVGTWVRISVQSHELVFFQKDAQQVENDQFVSTQNSIYFTVDEGQVRVNPSREKN